MLREIGEKTEGGIGGRQHERKDSAEEEYGN